MPKNIVVFSDGTGREGGEGLPTNIYKLFNVVEDRTAKQVAFYDRGLGTDWRRISGNAFGVGISENIKECYRFIFDNYQAGDRIYLFGFSRGAFTVRSLSGFVHHFGILPKSRPELIEEAYKIYKKSNPEDLAEKAAYFVGQHKTMWCTIRFIGVWDTVGALGVPFQSLDIVVNRFFAHKFHDTKISPAVEGGYHALAIDDEREVFHPTLWDETSINYVPACDEEGNPLYDKEGERIKNEQIIEQVWFTGAHSDVGGTFEKQGDPALSDISLEWMMDKAEAQGLRLYRGRRPKTNPDPMAPLHDSRAGLARFYKKASRANTVGLDKLRSIKVHQSVVNRNAVENDYTPWILQGDYEIEP